MHTRRPAARAWMALTTGVIGGSMILAACGSTARGSGVSAGEQPAQAVQTAFSKLGSQSDVKMVVSLQISANQAKQLASKSGGTALTDAEANAIHTGSVFLNVATGSGEALDSAQAQSDPNDSVDFGLTIGTSNPLEVVYTGGNLYARVQVQQLLSDVGQAPTKASQFTSQLNSLNTYVPGISQLGAGNWVEIDHAGLQSLGPLLKQIGSQSGTNANPSAIKTAMLSLRNQLVAALEANSTAKSTGTDQYSVTVQVANLLAAIKTDVQNANVPQIGPKITAALGGVESKIPAGQTAVMGVQTTSDGTLSQVQVDLNQFAGKHAVTFPVPLQLAFSSPGAPKAPSGATVLDVSKLPTLLGALLGSKSAA